MARITLAIANLRAAVVLLVVSFHSVVAYLGSQPASQPPFDAPPYAWRAFPILDNEKWFGFDLYCALIYVFLMPVMFFISGLFVWPSLLRKGVKEFVYGRLLRIGVPFVLGTVLLMPVAHYPVYRVTAADPSWSAFWTQWAALPFWATGPLWFLWNLLVLDFAAAALFWFAPGFGGVLGRLQAKAGEFPGRYLLGFAAVLVLAYLPMASVFRSWEWSQLGPFSVQPAQVPLYIVYFSGGLAAGANGAGCGLLEPDGMLARRWARWLGLGLAAFLSWPAAAALTMESQSPSLAVERLASTLFALSSVTACFAFIAIFLRFANRRVPVADNLAQNAYAIYLVHYPFVTWLQYLLLGQAILAVAKGAIVFIGAAVLSWTAAIALHRIPLLERFHPKPSR